MILLKTLAELQVVACAAALYFLVAKRQWREYWAIGSFLAVRLISGLTLLLFHLQSQRISRTTAYHIYFYVYWVAFAFESMLALLVVYSVFRLTIKPLKGLLKFGTILFGVVAGISGAGAIVSALTQNVKGTESLVAVISHLQRTQSLLTLGVLLFVLIALRPMGFSGRSRVVGISLGLGVMALNDLAQSAWLAFYPQTDIAYSVVNGVVICAILLMWIAYFAWPEPKRREIAGNSALLRWNRICLAWYDDVI